jgi:hypothetical protein
MPGGTCSTDSVLEPMTDRASSPSEMQSVFTLRTVKDDQCKHAETMEIAPQR